MPQISPFRRSLRAVHLLPEDQAITQLRARSDLSPQLRARATARATSLVQTIRAEDAPGLMEVFLAEYGLSTDEGIALMCLAEALLRVPDATTIDALIEDKIAPSAWGSHLGKSSSSLVNASTWALLLTGSVLRDSDGIAGHLRGAVKRLGEPVIRRAVARAMKELGAQFVLGETIEGAMARAARQEAKGYTYSYDMLGEAALTRADAENYFEAYSAAIAAIAPACKNPDIRRNPGISIKLSALFERYETPHRDQAMAHLVPRTLQLAQAAKSAGMGLNIDAEEADRLDLSLEIIEAVLADPSLAGWDGFGIVVQAYGKRAPYVLEWLHDLANRLDRKVMVRLVKGAYWDTEIKRAQVEGLTGFPVYTEKAATDVSYLCCAQMLLRMTDRIYPQFATHNAHSVAAILEMGAVAETYEFQRLHGMGAALHSAVKDTAGTQCRIYAPVGAHRDLLAYLVRRLLENGANSSFVNQIVDKTVAAETVAADPFAAMGRRTKPIAHPSAIFPGRQNSAGWDLHDPDVVDTYTTGRAPFAKTQWQAQPRLVRATGEEPIVEMLNPADPSDVVGHVQETTEADTRAAIANAASWDEDPETRARVLRRAADLYEANAPEIFALLTREAGKTAKDAVAELREAVDFLRYYADQASILRHPPRGLFTCISPWNFPLAIYTGQIAAALAAGNAVLAKPAETTPLIADLGARLLHQAGVPLPALQVLPGPGGTVGAMLSGDQRVTGVCFTGSTQTAHQINRSMANGCAPDAPLIAETGGLNAMIVDSTALPEQAVRDIVASAFQSAGQRCSACRVLYLQEDIAESFLKMLIGATQALNTTDPWRMDSDLGPVINSAAKATIEAHIEQAQDDGRVIYQGTAPQQGTFVAPTILKIDTIADLTSEIFGPVLHVATFKPTELVATIEAINATDYGLTFGMHSRIDDRVEVACSKIQAGNIYINRNQIGAVVGSQPFGGQGLSGTGPKAGGPRYVPHFTAAPRRDHKAPQDGKTLTRTQITQALHTVPLPDALPQEQDLPGPTGESNRLSLHPRGTILCLGPTPEAALEQRAIAIAQGCPALACAPGLTTTDPYDPTEDNTAPMTPGLLNGIVSPDILKQLEGIVAVACWADDETLGPLRHALAQRDGPLLPLISRTDMTELCQIERHICIDTTAAGGNATLLA